MIHSTTLNVAVMEVTSSGPGRIDLIQGTALGLPVSQVGVLPIPAGQYITPMTKDEAVQLRAKLDQAIQECPDAEPEKKSDLVVAQNLQGVEQIANIDRKVKGQ